MPKRPSVPPFSCLYPAVQPCAAGFRIFFEESCRCRFHHVFLPLLMDNAEGSGFLT